MAVWGQYGGRSRKKISMKSTDSPECALLLLENGADPSIVDDYGATALCTASGTGGSSSINLLLKHGADINHRDFISTTPLHSCFFRGTLDCLLVLLPHCPDQTILMEDGLLAIESAFRDDMSHMIEYLIQN
jgi:ankyrin repeat protein